MPIGNQNGIFGVADHMCLAMLELCYRINFLSGVANHMCLPVLKQCNRIQFSYKNRLYKYSKTEIGTEQIKNTLKLWGPKTKNQINYQS